MFTDKSVTTESKIERVVLEDKDIWLKAWLATANADNTVDSRTCTTYADNCLTAFKKRFDK